MQKNQTNLSSERAQIISASAGSGKTFAIAKRYVRLALGLEKSGFYADPSSILAITFTNKAALEMKRRILLFLKKIAFDSFENPNEKAELLHGSQLTQEQLKNKAVEVLDGIFKRYGKFRVQTIDSFVKAVLDGFAFELGLSASFSVESSHKEALSEALQVALTNAQNDTVLKNEFIEFADRYRMQNDTVVWLFSDKLLSTVSQLYNESASCGFDFAKPFALSTQDIKAKRESFIKLNAQLLEKLPKGTHKGFIKAINKTNETGIYFSVEGLGAYYKKEKIEITKNNESNEEAEYIFAKVKEELASIALAEAGSYYNSYLDVYNAVLSEVGRIAKHKDQLFLIELNGRMQELAQYKGVNPSEIYLHLAARYSHLLLDEFQDTNPLQWRNLTPLIEEALSCENGSVWIVGDVKQAIYGFRGGDSKIFASAYTQLEKYNPQKSSLLNNYRSAKEIVEFNNAVFSKENLCAFIEIIKINSDDNVLVENINSVKDALLSNFERVTQNAMSSSSGFVSVQYYGDKKEKTKQEWGDYLKEKFLKTIVELKSRYAYSSIAVLVNDNKDAAQFTQWLLEKNIPVKSDATTNILQNCLICQSIAFMTFLNSPIDNLAFATFIEGEVFTKASKISQEEIRNFIFNWHKTNRQDYLYRAFEKHYKTAWDSLIAPLFSSAGFMPLYEYFSTFIEKFAIFKNFPGNEVFFVWLLNIIKEGEEKLGEYATFNEYLLTLDPKKLCIPSADVDAVQVLSIHKAKGLEFDAVVLPAFAFDFGAHRDEVETVEYNGKLSLIKAGLKEAGYSKELKNLYMDIKKPKIIDAFNVAYVALTRAKKELFVFVPANSRNSNNLARFLLNETKQGNIENSLIMPELASSNKMPQPDCRDWLEFLRSEFPASEEIKGRVAIKNGKLYHLVLSKIGNLSALSEVEISKIASSAAAFALNSIFTNKNLESFNTEIYKFISSKELKDVFFNEQAEVSCEREIQDANGFTLRMDRLVVGENVLVVDFKSSKDNIVEHISQVQNYIDTICPVFAPKKVKGAIVYIDTQEVIWVKE
ncbi:MAG: UvrD-helicase domain-containing protein [Endomicrobiales bacterium]|nr:UvrD-helicase domain-containing protein [Endomicrobiales bacterium]